MKEVLTLLLLIGSAAAHEAPSGWKYPEDCCAGFHCRPVSCDALVETRDGVRFLDLTFSEYQVRASGDHSCHVCINYTQDVNGTKIRKPICAFVKPET